MDRVMDVLHPEFSMRQEQENDSGTFASGEQLRLILSGFKQLWNHDGWWPTHRVGYFRGVFPAPARVGDLIQVLGGEMSLGGPLHSIEAVVWARGSEAPECSIGRQVGEWQVSFNLSKRKLKPEPYGLTWAVPTLHQISESGSWDKWGVVSPGEAWEVSTAEVVWKTRAAVLKTAQAVDTGHRVRPDISKEVPISERLYLGVAIEGFFPLEFEPLKGVLDVHVDVQSVAAQIHEATGSSLRVRTAIVGRSGEVYGVLLHTVVRTNRERQPILHNGELKPRREA